MSSKRTGVAPGASGAASKKAAQPRGAAALHPPPASATAAVASGAASQPKRFDWIESTVGGSTLPAGLRPASRADSRAGSRPRSPAPDFWSRQSAAQVVDASVKDPALKLTLLTRALEESRARIAHLQQDRTAVADAVLELCLAAGAGPAGCSAGGGEAVAAGDDADAPTAAAAEEDVLPLRLDQLGTRLAQLRQALAEQEVAAAEARAAHERAALQVVAGQQQREALDAQLEEARYAAQQHDAARHAAQTKAALLEEQLGAAAESARRRMEEQLDTFRGDAATARTLRGRFTELERQLAAAQSTQRADADERPRLEGAAARLQGRLAEVEEQAAQTRQQLWDKAAAHADLSDQHHLVQEERRGLAADKAALEAALAEARQRAQQAETLGAGLQAECGAGRQLAAALQEEADELRGELQQERQRTHGLQAALAEARLTCASQRAALQGRGDEVASLAASLDQYSHRIVATEGELEGAREAAAAAAAAQEEAEEEAAAALHEAACLREALEDLAATEAQVKQELGEARAAAAAAKAAAEQAQQRGAQQEREAAAAKEEAAVLRATAAEQALRLAQAAGLRQQVEAQQEQLAAHGEELRAAAARQASTQAAADEVATAKQAAERSLHKQTVVAQRLQERTASLSDQLAGATKEAAAAAARAQAAEVAAGQQAEQHAAAVAALQAAHEQRKTRNEHLEHENKQQAILVAELEARAISFAARLQASQEHAAALQRYAVAHGAAYGRLTAHAGGLHQGLARQLGSLLSLCRHLGLQLSAALSAADPLAPLQQASSGKGCETTAEDGVAASATAAPASHEASAAGVAAAVLSIESLRTELAVATQLLEMQAGSSEVQQLAAVPAGIAQALSADLAGLPPALLASPRLASAAPELSGSSPQQPSALQVPSASQPAALPAAAPALPTQSAAPQSALSAQVAQMEAHVERLVATGTERAAAAAAATQLHRQEQGARQRAQDLATQLAAQLDATQADLAATRQQRDELDASGRRLARELRDAIYTLSQLHAAQQGPAASWRVRGLQSAGTQTHYCQLWASSLCGPPPGADGCEAGASGDGSVLCAAGDSSASSAGSEDGSSCGASPPAPGPAPPAPAPARVLALPALQHQIRELYRWKAAADIAVARGQRPFQPLPDFVASYLAQQCGSEGAAVAARARQLQASVEAHAAADREVALFGLAAGMLEEDEPEAAGGCSLQAPPGALVVVPAGGTTAGLPRSSTAAAAAPLVLYHSRRRAGTAAAQRAADALPTLRRFGASAWHAAAAAAAARPPLAGSGRPFNPAGPDQLLHPMAAEVHNLSLSVPGVEQLASWVLAGGLGPLLPRLDLGLRLAENQAPQLYLLAAEACRLLGMPDAAPQLWVKGSSEAAAYYLILPADAPLHGLNGGPPPEPALPGTCVASAAGTPGTPGSPAPAAAAAAAAGGAAESARSSSSGTYGLELQPSRSLAEVSAARSLGGAVAAVEAQQWRCALVLTSALVDLLEPHELQAVLAGCLGFHAALTCPAAAGLAPGDGPEAAQLALLCRSAAALASLDALCALGPDALAARLPAAMAPFFYSRIQPVLRRAGRYLQLSADRVGAAATGGWRPLAAAAVKRAAGCSLLRNELNLDAVIAQAAALEEAGAQLLPAALGREEGGTMAATGASLALLQVRELQRWWAARQ